MRPCYDRAALRLLTWAELAGIGSTEAAQERQYRSRLALVGERVPADQLTQTDSCAQSF